MYLTVVLYTISILFEINCQQIKSSQLLLDAIIRGHS